MSQAEWTELVKVGDDAFDLASCPRCGGEHKALQFQRFKKPLQELLPRELDDPVIFHLWALCPASGEPVLCVDPSKLEWLVRHPPAPGKVAAVAEELWRLEGCPEGRAPLH